VAEWKAGSLNWKTVLSLAGLRWIRFLRCKGQGWE
jgi:hypothetical protein